MKFPVKMPTGNQLFWTVLIAFIVALVAIWLSNNNDTVEDLTK